MLTRSYSLRFVAPAFLGNAEQSAQWRSPPFKALLRQWWRVARAAGAGVDPRTLRSEEAALFGAVGDEGTRRSAVRIRLSAWSSGRLRSWDHLEAERVAHPEVQQTRHRVGPHLYLGFGPLTADRTDTRLGDRMTAAIDAGEVAQLRLALPGSAETRRIEQALALMGAYGAVGGRSRNGWGSFVLEPIEGTPALPGDACGAILRDWKAALAEDWPHALGRDSRPLVWQTAPQPDWRRAMRCLAEVRIRVRTERFPFTTGKSAMHPEARHWLAYPVTRHDVRSWGRLRLPNSLRFRLRPTEDGRVIGVVFHMPCMPPPEFQPERRTIEAVWTEVHATLDAPGSGLTRIAA